MEAGRPAGKPTSVSVFLDEPAPLAGRRANAILVRPASGGGAAWWARPAWGQTLRGAQRKWRRRRLAHPLSDTKIAMPAEAANNSAGQLAPCTKLTSGSEKRASLLLSPPQLGSPAEIDSFVCMRAAGRPAGGWTEELPPRSSCRRPKYYYWLFARSPERRAKKVAVRCERSLDANHQSLSPSDLRGGDYQRKIIMHHPRDPIWVGRPAGRQLAFAAATPSAPRGAPRLLCCCCWCCCCCCCCHWTLESVARTCRRHCAPTSAPGRR